MDLLNDERNSEFHIPGAQNCLHLWNNCFFLTYELVYRPEVESVHWKGSMIYIYNIGVIRSLDFDQMVILACFFLLVCCPKATPSWFFLQFFFIRVIVSHCVKVSDLLGREVLSKESG